MGNNKPSSLRFAIVAGTGAFFTAVFFSFFSEVVLPKLQILILSFLFLLLVIVTGIVFDMIGVATAVADEKPFHAKATKKLQGASHAILIVRNADKVATFCNDVVGDICGTVSGALGAAIIFQIVAGRLSLNKFESLLSMVMTGIVAAVTVGGKAAGKRTALNDSEQIVFAVGRVLAKIEAVIGLRLLTGNRKGREKRR
ncbi:MAG: hypothetical protein ACYC21_09595 [Eubacteriales bacterium]